jgi:hypothetical protein
MIQDQEFHSIAFPRPLAAKNYLVHSEQFRVYKLPIWAVKMEIVGIAPTLGQQRGRNAAP